MLGGALGAGCRYGISLWMSTPNGTGFPWGTFSVNMLGCLLIGLLWQWQSGNAASAWFGPLVITGFLGGFTTFSAFGLESFKLYRSGEMVVLTIYVLLSNIAGLLCVLTGNKMGELIGK